MEDLKLQLIKSEVDEPISEPQKAEEQENHEILTSAIFIENKPAILFYHSESELVQSQEGNIQSIHVQSIKDIESSQLSEPPEQREEELLQDRIEKALQRATQNAERRLEKLEKQRQTIEKPAANGATKQCNNQNLQASVKKCRKIRKLTQEQRMAKLINQRARTKRLYEKKKAEREQLMREREKQGTIKKSNQTPEYIKYLYEFKRNKFGCKDENT